MEEPCISVPDPLCLILENEREFGDIKGPSPLSKQYEFFLAVKHLKYSAGMEQNVSQFQVNRNLAGKLEVGQRQNVFVVDIYSLVCCLYLTSEAGMLFGMVPKEYRQKWLLCLISEDMERHLQT